MENLKCDELLNVSGGSNISGTLINALAKGVSTIYDIGRSLGTAIRRIGSNNICPI